MSPACTYKHHNQTLKNFSFIIIIMKILKKELFILGIFFLIAAAIIAFFVKTNFSILSSIVFAVLGICLIIMSKRGRLFIYKKK